MKRSLIVINKIFLIYFIIYSINLQAQTCYSNIEPTAPDQRFQIEEPTPNEAVVIDTETSLMWKRCSEGLEGRNCDQGIRSKLTWEAALLSTISQGFAGYSDWRVPDIKELTSLLEMSCRVPVINGNIFPVFGGGYYWTSSTNIDQLDQAWVIYFNWGYITTGSKDGTNELLLVRNN
ncbi:hypothetical protein BS333_15265 [Vibrio azureus]|uniref:Lcl C-terminal domain-containing protein n=1 Tax=Vibrio azureus NBRC 104587 TaxID=1219077 RepID=U3ATM4_9VIBR|nr:DUF1566 domain-containing protein [Vibrio azureus]AUI87760.1 hypothetical protein BS333_15265 [Vibrio azureus]GAD76592.1 hypothetical protein VAZ01S_047_00030 [Vibrio azureus NBRC 104587]